MLAGGLRCWSLCYRLKGTSRAFQVTADICQNVFRRYATAVAREIKNGLIVPLSAGNLGFPETGKILTYGPLTFAQGTDIKN